MRRHVTEAQEILTQHKLDKLMYKQDKTQNLIPQNPTLILSNLVRKHEAHFKKLLRFNFEVDNVLTEKLDAIYYHIEDLRKTHRDMYDTLDESCQRLKGEYEWSIASKRSYGRPIELMDFVISLYDPVIKQNDTHNCPFRWFEFSKNHKPCISSSDAAKTIKELSTFYGKQITLNITDDCTHNAYEILDWIYKEPIINNMHVNQTPIELEPPPPPPLPQPPKPVYEPPKPIPPPYIPPTPPPPPPTPPPPQPPKPSKQARVRGTPVGLYDFIIGVEEYERICEEYKRPLEEYNRTLEEYNRILEERDRMLKQYKLTGRKPSLEENNRISDMLENYTRNLENHTRTLENHTRNLEEIVDMFNNLKPKAAAALALYETVFMNRENKTLYINYLKGMLEDTYDKISLEHIRNIIRIGKIDARGKKKVIDKRNFLNSYSTSHIENDTLGLPPKVKPKPKTSVVTTFKKENGPILVPNPNNVNMDMDAFYKKTNEYMLVYGVRDMQDDIFSDDILPPKPRKYGGSRKRQRRQRRTRRLRS